MSRFTQSKHPAYHLRPNKAIDRSIFIELLHSLDGYRSLEKHIYIGFGGPFLEDFRLVARDFPNMRMHSVEIDGETYKRQSFHQCTNKMRLFKGSFKDYLSLRFPGDYPTITWADYIGFDREKLLEASDIARMATPFSIIRVTVDAESPLYAKLGVSDPAPKAMPSGQKKMFERFVADYCRDIEIQDVEYRSGLFTWSSFIKDNYPDLLAELISSVLSKACTYPKVYLPLHSAKYSDGTIMLSLTGMVCLDKDRERIVNHLKKRCEFYSPEVSPAETIDVPMLTTKERLHLERKMPVSKAVRSRTLKHLGYLIEGDGSIGISGEKMGQYEKYHRLYPYFGKLIP